MNEPAGLHSRRAQSLGGNNCQGATAGQCLVPTAANAIHSQPAYRVDCWEHDQHGTSRRAPAKRVRMQTCILTHEGHGPDESQMLSA
jgi:hypothetical protein